MIKTVLFGSSIHSLKIIEALKSTSDMEIVGLVSQPDRPTGRKQILTPTPVSEYAKNNSLPLFNPESTPEKPWEISNPQKLLDFVKSAKADLIIVTYYGQRIPKEIINLPKFGSLNIHPSLLPNYPGSSPAVWAILEGESITGVTIIKMNENFDEGEIVAQANEDIKATDTPEDLYERLFTKGADLLIKTLPDYLNGKGAPRKQGTRTSVYAKRLTREDGKIDWLKPPEYQDRFIRAMSPWPSAWTEIEIEGHKKKLKILKSHLSNNELIIDIVQMEGKNPVPYNQFQAGYPKVALNANI